jgi:hypothetical protein
MTAPRRVYLGSYEGGVHHLTIPREVLASAEAKLDQMRAEEARALAAKANDIERAKATRRARAMRRLTRALKLFRRS